MLTKQRRLLDLFCGAGGAAMGYYRAGFTEIVGIDIEPQPNYPFQFIQADALQPPVDLTRFDAIHASPPCQAFSAMQRANVMRKDHPNLIDQTREMLIRSGVPWVMENVIGAPLINPTLLCGQFFGLRVLRHRLFESSLWILSPPHITHTRQAKVRGSTTPEHLASLAHIGFTTGSVMAAYRDAMGCHWMTVEEGRQAIPPAYTQWLGERILQTEPSPDLSLETTNEEHQDAVALVT